MVNIEKVNMKIISQCAICNWRLWLLHHLNYIALRIIPLKILQKRDKTILLSEITNLALHLVYRTTRFSQIHEFLYLYSLLASEKGYQFNPKQSYYEVCHIKYIDDIFHSGKTCCKIVFNQGN